MQSYYISLRTIEEALRAPESGSSMYCVALPKNTFPDYITLYPQVRPEEPEYVLDIVSSEAVRNKYLVEHELSINDNLRKLETTGFAVPREMLPSPFNAKGEDPKPSDSQGRTDPGFVLEEIKHIPDDPRIQTYGKRGMTEQRAIDLMQAFEDLTLSDIEAGLRDPLSGSSMYLLAVQKNEHPDYIALYPGKRPEEPEYMLVVCEDRTGRNRYLAEHGLDEEDNRRRLATTGFPLHRSELPKPFNRLPPDNAQ